MKKKRIERDESNTRISKQNGERRRTKIKILRAHRKWVSLVPLSPFELQNDGKITRNQLTNVQCLWLQRKHLYFWLTIFCLDVCPMTDFSDIIFAHILFGIPSIHCKQSYKKNSKNIDISCVLLLPLIFFPV